MGNCRGRYAQTAEITRRDSWHRYCCNEVMLKLKVAAVVATGVLMSLAGCSAKITSSACEYNGESYDLGETFTAADGCNTCSCDDEGVSCTEMGCSSCQGEQPDCGAPPPGCTVDTVCLGDGWSCELRCDCSEAPPIDCEAPPPGCFYDGPSCVDGNWSCGELICSGNCESPEPECTQPGAPGCFSYASCTEFGWECLTQCDPCAAKPPVCPEDPTPGCFVSAQCFDSGWECISTCGEPSCELLYQAGYELLVQAVITECGCVDDAPCANACAGTAACENFDPQGVCAECVQEEADNGGACVESAAFGPQCQENMDCYSYVQCLLVN